MAVTFGTATRADETLLNVSFSSDAATPVTFRVWHNGVMVSTITSDNGAASIDLHIPIGETHDVQIFDDALSVPKPAYPGRLTLHWTEIAEATKYRIEQKVAGVWVLQAVTYDDGEGAWVWLSGWLDDVTVYEFRVLAVDEFENQGTSLPFIVEMVRTPDVPDVTYAWNAGTGKITITAT